MPLACSKLPCTRTIHGWASLDKKHLFPALTADHPRKLPKIWQSASRSKAALGQRDHSVTLRVWTLTMPGYGLRFPCFFPHCTKISLCKLKRAQDLENGKFQPDKAISWRIANVMLEDCVHMNIFLKFWVPQTISVFFLWCALIFKLHIHVSKAGLTWQLLKPRSWKMTQFCPALHYP